MIRVKSAPILQRLSRIGFVCWRSIRLYMKVIIIGGGIGGLTTAIALQQRGIEYEVYEAAPELREIGAGIWVPPNAMNVFERLGIAEKIRRAGKLMEKISVG